ncbi:hypothetical protein ON010_g8157 [Phytophthora cinnamomi]|nr:hypothetical protein ON010_g8157 [Phytophthora cinnamomi]
MQESELPDINNFGKQVVHATVEVLRAFERKARSNSLPERIDSDIVALDLHTDDLQEVLAQDGCSLHTLLRKARKQNPTLVVVETTKGDIFGGFASEEWQDSANYYGIGESFVFSFNAKFECYPWSYLNTMIMLSNDECIAMGGGRLTSEAEFGIYNVEVWGFVTKM